MDEGERPDVEQPRAPEGRPPTPPPQPTPRPTASTGLDPKVAALLSYVLGWVTGLIFYLIEREDKYVRFHAMQSIIFSVALIIVGFALQLLIGIFFLASPSLAYLLGLVLSLVWLGALVLWIVLMIRAYQGEKWKLPIIGDMAERYE